MSRILSRISMSTGQISSHALHDVHAQSSSAVTRSKSESAPTVMSRSTPTGGGTLGAPGARIDPPALCPLFPGSGGLSGAIARATQLGPPPIPLAAAADIHHQ